MTPRRASSQAATFPRTARRVRRAVAVAVCGASSLVATGTGIGTGIGTGTGTASGIGTGIGTGIGVGDGASTGAGIRRVGDPVGSVVGGPPLRTAGDLGGSGPRSPTSRPSSHYRPPLSAPVVDPFRAPVSRYAAGNRGLEYAAPYGAPVHSIGAGVVAFAGQVAGRLVVSVVHPDGLRSALTGLSVIGVRVGDRVDAATVIGRAGRGLHLGVRRGRDYLDPASLFGGTEGRPTRSVLVPTR